MCSTFFNTEALRALGIHRTASNMTTEGLPKMDPGGVTRCSTTVWPLIQSRTEPDPNWLAGTTLSSWSGYGSN